MIRTEDDKCPYGADDCPKVEDLKSEVSNLRKELQTISHYLYMIIGMVAINWGITLW